MVMLILNIVIHEEMYHVDQTETAGFFYILVYFKTNIMEECSHFRTGIPPSFSQRKVYCLQNGTFYGKCIGLLKIKKIDCCIGFSPLEALFSKCEH